MRDQERSPAWDREDNVECVVCPDCAFTFDAFHSDKDDRYSCPCCVQDRLERQLAEKDEALRALIAKSEQSAHLPAHDRNLIESIARSGLSA